MFVLLHQPVRVFFDAPLSCGNFASIKYRGRESKNNDPKVDIDLVKKRAVLRGDDRDDDGAWKVTLQLRDKR